MNEDIGKPGQVKALHAYSHWMPLPEGPEVEG